MPHYRRQGYIRIYPDPETMDRILEEAARHKRRVPEHACALLRWALGMPFPIPLEEQRERDQEHEARAAKVHREMEERRKLS